MTRIGIGDAHLKLRRLGNRDRSEPGAFAGAHDGPPSLKGVGPALDAIAAGSESGEAGASAPTRHGFAGCVPTFRDNDEAVLPGSLAAEAEREFAAHMSRLGND